jgi:hypothetical protein
MRKLMDERNAENPERKKVLDYHRQYNTDHAVELAAAKKKKYDTDPKYKAAAKKRSSSAYQRKKKLMEEIKKVMGPPPPNGTRGSNQIYCPTCNQPIPKPPKPVYKSVDKKYAVAMYTIAEVARRLGKQTKTLQIWLQNKVIPDTLYKDRRTKQGAKHVIMTRLWTQDQVEMLMRVISQFDLRPPVSFQKIGMIAAIRREWDKLRPLGIDPKLYDCQTEQGYLARPSADLPTPAYGRKNPQKEQEEGHNDGES